MMGLGFGELVLIFLIALIFIGPKKLPELAKGLGRGIRDFQNAAKGITDQLQNEADSANNTTSKIAETTPVATQQEPTSPIETPLEDKDHKQS